MKSIITYLLAVLVVCVIMYVYPYISTPPIFFSDNILFIKSALMGCTGGILYCLRGIYKNRCVNKCWDPNWEVWYYIRPITSLISGFVSSIFMKAGLLVLDSGSKEEPAIYGYLVIAFIAGYNVDNFLKKLEDIATSIWGINKTGTASNQKEENTNKDTLNHDQTASN